MVVTERKRKGGMGTHREDNRTMDDTWAWIEGLKDGKWFPLYCFRETDIGKAQGLTEYLKVHLAAGDRLADSLNDFQNFRLHPSGVWMEVEATSAEVRSLVGAEDLARILRKLNQTECGALRESTGERCVLPPRHTGKHSSQRKV